MTVNKKYEFVDGDTKKLIDGTVLKRIRSLVAIGSIVIPGDLGGYVESDKNLSVYGNAWVSGNALVYGNARVSGDAWVSGNALVYGDAEIKKTPINIIGINYNITIYEGMAQVGCKLYKIEEWRKFNSDEIRKMDGEKAILFYPKLIKIFDSLGI